MFQAFIVGLGGFFGSILRYSVSGLAHRIFSLTNFPIGTLTVNIVGCFLIGLTNGLIEARQVSPNLRLFILVGVFGGFTTFSSFGYETFALLADDELLYSLINVSVQVAVGLAAVWLGNALGHLA